MELAESSGDSSPPESEPVHNCHLVLTALSGTTVNVSVSVAKYDRLEDLEDHVVDYLASVTDLKVFGCTIDFLHADTETYLVDPIWDQLRQSAEYCIIFRDCIEVLHTQEGLEGCPIHSVPLAVHVPLNPETTVPEGAFAGVPRLRHVSVASGISFIGAEAWQNCRQLRIVNLPDTVVGIADNVFRGCKLLNIVTASGCRDFGYKAFAECSSLQWVYAAGNTTNQFSCTTKLGQYLFRDCINLADFTLQECLSWDGISPLTTTNELAQGCLNSTGIATLQLTPNFSSLGAHACDTCPLLKTVDLSRTTIEEIQEFTFAHCTSLTEISLPYTLRTIRVKAFMNCAALPMLAVPPSLRYIASRAFLDCTALQRIVKLPGRHKWRGIYAEENALAICTGLRWPPWLHMIPDTGYTSGRA